MFVAVLAVETLGILKMPSLVDEVMSGCAVDASGVGAIVASGGRTTGGVGGGGSGDVAGAVDELALVVLGD